MAPWMFALSLILATALAGPALHPAAAQSLPSTVLEASTGAAEGESTAEAEVTPDAKTTTAPTYCKPCLYYSGDFNPGDVNANAQLDGNNRSSLTYIYTPVSIAAGRTWHVSGLIINSVNASATGGIVDPANAGWSVWQGVAAGVPGTLIAGGVASASVTPTGRVAQLGFTEYTIIVKLKPALKLASGTYFVNVLPQCTNAANTKCSVGTFESNVVDASPTHQFGPANLLGASFFNSVPFAANYANAAFGLYSFGVMGTSSGH